jgi:hypothetical protein
VTPAFAVAELPTTEIFTGGKLCQLTFADVRDEIIKSGLARSTVGESAKS